MTSPSSTAGSSAYSRLVEHLRQLEQLYGQLIEMENRKKNAIRGNRMAEVQALNEAEERLLDRFEEENRLRREALAEWQRDRGLDAHPAQAPAEMPASPDDPAEREALRALGSRLEQAAEQLKSAAEANRELLQISLDMTLDLMDPGGAPGDDYIYRNPKDETATVRRPSGYDVRM